MLLLLFAKYIIITGKSSKVCMVIIIQYIYIPNIIDDYCLKCSHWCKLQPYQTKPNKFYRLQGVGLTIDPHHDH